MKLQKSSIEIIKMRSSCRTFDSCDIEDEKLQKLKDYIEEINTETKIRARFLFIKQQKNSSGSSEKIGTYGVISGANSFVVGIIHKDERDAVEFGYLFEKIILFATDLGLQTCWLGG
ncbi:MAG: nitroreductase family protein, partial [Sedimentibacter sp.]